MPPLPPPVDYNTDAPADYLEKGTSPPAALQQNKGVLYSRTSCLCPVVALYSYEASKPDDLAFSEGDIIYLTRRQDNGWCEGVSNGKQGFFPMNYVQSCG